ncbi:MAG: hypothetical protein M1828_004368 [Chrysothrix sp. TS-e1954]|nr:MAG: hypothetical protein M1828_004368 [Chrysothrix sp. TS-e1954]
MAQSLPEDVLHLVCQELALREDFPTLFKCAVSSKTLAPLALAALYRNHGKSRVNDEEAEGSNAAPQQELLVQKWSIMWRSIILAALNGTLFPYCRYLKSLELRDLQNLLEDSKFRGRIQTNFFSGSLSKFHHEVEVQAFKRHSDKRVNRPSKRLDVQTTIEAIGDAIIPQQPFLEQLSGQFSSSSLKSWATSLKNLQRLELRDGDALTDVDGAMHRALHKNCPGLKALMIFQWQHPGADEMLANFIKGMRPNSLQTLQTLTDRCGISTQTCLALSEHGQSLKHVHLCFDADAVASMGLLQGCTAVEALHLEMPNTIDLELTQHDVFLELIGWLRQCTKLRKIVLNEFRSAPSILLPLLQTQDLALAELEINANRNLYKAEVSLDFHRALAKQTTLRSLRLKAEGESDSSLLADTVVDCVSKLVNLKELQLPGISETFGDQETIELLTPLTQLEGVFLGGYEVGDRVLDAVARLQHLKSITFQSLSVFTMNGLLDFISKLGPGNRGLAISIDNADPDSLLQDQEVQIVRETLSTKVGGRLDTFTDFLPSSFSTLHGEIPTFPSLKANQTKVLAFEPDKQTGRTYTGWMFGSITKGTKDGDTSELN